MPERTVLERGAELAVLDDLVRRVRDGGSALVVLDGPAGIGKTTLLRSVRARAEAAGLPVVTGVGSELERQFGFGVVRQLIEPRLAAAGAARREQWFTGPARFARPVLEEAPGPVDAVPADALGAALHGLYWLLAGFADHGPFLVLVDDVHWADLSSLRWLAYLARRLDGLPVGLLLAVRAGETPADPRAVEEILASPLCQVLRPEPLTAAAVGDLARVELGGPVAAEFAAACVDSTGGNPLLLTELLRGLRAHRVTGAAAETGLVPEFGVAAIATGVLGRLRRCPPETGQVADAVAVLGPAATLAQVERLTGLGGPQVQACVRRLVALGLFVVDGPKFVHPMVREVVYRDLPTGARSALHERVAELMQARAAGFERAGPDQVATHLLPVAPAGVAWRVTALRAAAAVARTRGAPETSAAYLARAIEEGPEVEPELYAELGRAQLHFDGLAAVRTLGIAHERAGAAARPGLTVDLARALLTVGRGAEGLSLITAAVTAAEGSTEHGYLQSELYFLCWQHSGTAPMISQRLADLTEVAESGLLGLRSCHEVFRLGSSALALAQARRALAGPALYTEHWGPHMSAVMTLIRCDDLDRAAAVTSEAVTHARRQGSFLRYALSTCLRVQVRLRQGRLDLALADAEESIGDRDPGWQPLAAHRYAHYLDVLLALDRTDDALELLYRMELDGELPALWHFNQVLDVRGRLRLALGDLDGALADFTECGRRLACWDVRNPAVIPWRSYQALALHAAGRRTEALAVLEPELAAAREWGLPWTLGTVLRVAGTITGGRAGEALLAEALAVVEHAEVGLVHAEVLTELGLLRHRLGAEQSARETLRRALAVAEQCGAIAVGRRARAGLRAAGGRQRRAEHTGPAALTGTERRVAALAADGRSNPQIAAELTVGVRTVEMHLTNAYRKLGVSGRTELTAALNS
ncbi:MULTISPECIES: AAA family ATPase [unclassified Crossiella]|uniref:ATP-binding protein n=1 Tax=unclassified Crossiella TaxID=2620835 RepID=UPI001FFF6615|nr:MULTISPECIES: helix-turn-helix transcriptional regulator [unclassified Crossiella]MCK2237274.1 AAA family ATPase [Crossiella sp. S99.2]MCK2250929.1 AAA family ATPase [Crossiella sp. S99.1]